MFINNNSKQKMSQQPKLDYNTLMSLYKQSKENNDYLKELYSYHKYEINLLANEKTNLQGQNKQASEEVKKLKIEIQKLKKQLNTRVEEVDD